MRIEDLINYDKLSKQKIKCSYYSDLDEQVIEKATELGMPLIGGTALEILANHYGTSGVRKRSNNDLDFLSDDKAKIAKLRKYLVNNIDPDKVQVDVHTQVPKGWKKYAMNVDGVLVMSPAYLIWSKLTRWSEKDQIDIKWLLTIKQLSDDEINNTLDDLGVTQEEFERLESLL